MSPARSNPNNSSSMAGYPPAPPITPSILPLIAEVLTKHACVYTPKIAAQMLGKTRIAGIGEGTHRAKEMFQAQSDIIKERIENHGCRVIFIEADESDVYAISRALNRANLNEVPKLLKELFFPTLSSKGIRNLLDFVAQWNHQKPRDRVEVIGIDFQARGATARLRGTLQTRVFTDQLRNDIETLCNQWDEADQNRRATNTVCPTLWSSIPRLAQTVALQVSDHQSRLDCKSLETCSNLFLTPEKNQDGLQRDVHMAERINEYLQRHENVSGVVIAHNGHISSASKSKFSDGMGHRIKEKNRDYKALLQFAEKGTLSGLPRDPDGNMNKAFPELAEKDLERVLALVASNLGTDQSILIDIDALKKDSAASWVLGHSFHANSIGIKIDPSSTFTITLGEGLNSILFQRSIIAEEWV